MSVKDEKLLLLECAIEGATQLQKYSQHHCSGHYMSPLLFDGLIDAGSYASKYLYNKNANIFYAFLPVLLSCGDLGKVSSIIKKLNSTADFDRSLEYMESKLYNETQFERDLCEWVSRYTEMTDDSIKSEFNNRFDVSNIDILELPADRSIFFAKINHGYWEYMRAAYDVASVMRDQFRDVDTKCRVRRLRTSGVSQFWGQQIHNAYSIQDAVVEKCADRSFCISLTNGVHSVSQSIRRGLNPVTRGAAIGLLSMFSAAVPEVGRCAVGDGRATRLLISERRMVPFYETFIADTNACLFVVPAHLKDIDLVGYEGCVYKFIVPSTKLNETWKAVVATLLGYIGRLAKKHDSIVILAQGASIASLMAMLLSDIDAFQNIKIRFFDLGRVLDVAAPEVLSKQNWLGGKLEEYIEEGKRIFSTTGDAPSLATLV